VEACRYGRTSWTDREGAHVPLAPLDPAAIGEALRDVLRNHHRANRLAASPLLELAWYRGSDDPPATRVARRSSELVVALGDEGHDGMLARVLTATYLAPPRKGLAVAESLGMGYSTYRRWLALALVRVTHELVEREQAARRRV
jgi:hypothetical protein